MINFYGINSYFMKQINPTIKVMNIEELRTKIDKIDSDILNLLNEEWILFTR